MKGWQYCSSHGYGKRYAHRVGTRAQIGLRSMRDSWRGQRKGHRLLLCNTASWFCQPSRRFLAFPKNFLRPLIAFGSTWPFEFWSRLLWSCYGWNGLDSHCSSLHHQTWKGVLDRKRITLLWTFWYRKIDHLNLKLEKNIELWYVSPWQSIISTF